MEQSMIIVAGVMDVAPDQRDAYLASKRNQVARTLDEPGCREYAFSIDADLPGRVRLFELWESFADFKAHVAGLGADPDSGPSIPVESSSIQVFEAEPSTQSLA
jgi:quinol monooxygenase YgiN